MTIFLLHLIINTGHFLGYALLNSSNSNYHLLGYKILLMCATIHQILFYLNTNCYLHKVSQGIPSLSPSKRVLPQLLIIICIST